MQLQLQDFAALVRSQAAAVTASCRTLIDVSVGSVLRAVLEANASVGLWMQWLIMEVLSTTRAATSQGADLDSWMADFGVSRLAAVPASGVARFSRVSPGLAAVVPVGALVRTGVTADAQGFVVVADARRADWTGSGYAVAAAAAEIVVPVRAVVAGRAGNVQAGVLRLLSTAIPGIDAVTNDDPATGGLEAETDDALRSRFAEFLDSRTRATAQAIGFAVRSMQQGLTVVIAEGVDSAGAARAGHFTVVIDDGSGVPSGALLAAVGAAVEAFRPVGATYAVIGPRLVPVTVSLRVVGPGPAVDAVRAAVGGFVGSLPIGGEVIVSRLVQVAHEASVDVVRVSDVLVNGRPGDLPVDRFGRAVASRVVVQS